MDLISLPVEFDEKKIDGRFRLVLAVAKRARELYQGSQPKISSKARKMTTLALEEVIAGNISVLTGNDAIKAREESKKLTLDEMMDEAKQRDSLPEDLSELEKDLKVYLHEKGAKENSKTIEEIFPEKGK